MANLLSFEQNVWEVKDSIFIPVRCLSLSAPRVVIELMEYGRRYNKNAQHCRRLMYKCSSGYMTIKPGIVECVIVNDIRAF